MQAHGSWLVQATPEVTALYMVRLFGRDQVQPCQGRRSSGVARLRIRFEKNGTTEGIGTHGAGCAWPYPDAGRPRVRSDENGLDDVSVLDRGQACSGIPTRGERPAGR